MVKTQLAQLREEEERGLQGDKKGGRGRMRKEEKKREDYRGTRK